MQKWEWEKRGLGKFVRRSITRTSRWKVYGQSWTILVFLRFKILKHCGQRLIIDFEALKELYCGKYIVIFKLFHQDWKHFSPLAMYTLTQSKSNFKKKSGLSDRSHWRISAFLSMILWQSKQTIWGTLQLILCVRLKCSILNLMGREVVPQCMYGGSLLPPIWESNSGHQPGSLECAFTS